jgi:hypothetical protein
MIYLIVGCYCAMDSYLVLGSSASRIMLRGSLKDGVESDDYQRFDLFCVLLKIK